MIAIGVIFWFVYKEEYIFRLRYLTVGLILIGAFILFSNIYQSYRDVLFSVGKVNPKRIENPVSAAECPPKMRRVTANAATARLAALRLRGRRICDSFNNFLNLGI